MINVTDEADERRRRNDELELASAWEAFVGSFTSSDPNLAERIEEILRAEVGR